MCIVGCAMSGLIADSRTLIDKARVEAQVCNNMWNRLWDDGELKEGLAHSYFGSLFAYLI